MVVARSGTVVSNGFAATGPATRPASAHRIVNAQAKTSQMRFMIDSSTIVACTCAAGGSSGRLHAFVGSDPAAFKLLLRVPVSADTVTHMKTTIDISDPLLESAKKVAAREGTTLRALVELGLRQVLEKRRRGGAFRLRKASFRGEGLQPSARSLSWEKIRELAYGDRGR